MQTSLLRIETLSSPPIATPSAQLYIHSQLVQIRIPPIRGGLIWNRPVAVEVRTLDGSDKMLPILDITRVAVFALFGLCSTSLLVLMLLGRKKYKSR